MKAIRIHAYGGPEQMQFDDAPMPVCGATDLLVRVVAAGINPIVGQEFALADAAHAHRLGEGGQARGKMVLHVNPPRV